jgi:CheY-like chemotaxis protein
MLIDDNPHDNFFHERAIRMVDTESTVIVKENGIQALEYLKSSKGTAPADLIFLDINMPGMNGWEFLQQYVQLDKELQNGIIVIMLTTSDNPDDQEKAHQLDFVSDFITKPLTQEAMQKIIDKHFI